VVKEALQVPYNFKTLIFYHPDLNIGFLKSNIKKGFNKSYKLTIGVDILTTDINLNNNQQVKFCFWDIATTERYRFFRNSFYKGASSAIIVFDYKNPITTSLIPDTINEIYNTIGPVPIIIVGLNANSHTNMENIKDIIQKDYIFYFDFEKKIDFYDKVLTFVADLSIKLLKESKDTTTSKIKAEIQKFIDLKEECLENFYDILTDWGLTIVDNYIKILNKYGLFSIDLVDGSVFFEPIMCENCNRLTKCQKANKIPKKKLCIVADSVGWSNILIGGDKLLILSKILAILNGELPTHVLNQMKQVLKCLDISSPPENSRFGDFSTFNENNKEYLVYENLSTQEIENRIKQLRIFLWEGRIPPPTYYRMVECLNQKNPIKN